MTTQSEMEIAYVTQAEVIAALYEIGDPDLAARLERCASASPLWRWLAIFVPIRSLRLVSSRDDPWMVVRHA
jgi:hypothetical protein